MSTTPLRVIIAGCGGIAGNWLSSLKDRRDVVVAGLVDLDPARATARAKEFALTTEIGSDLAAMIDRLRPDAVLDLTVPVAHAEVACLALGKGCHVFSEKPLAGSMADARRIRAAAEQSGKVHAVMQNRRWLNTIRRFRSLLASGNIGELTELHADFFIGAHFDGFRTTMDHVLLLDMAIHTFDQARFITGLDPVAVNALEWNPAGSWYRHGASALVCVEMQGGLRFTYRGSWCSEGGTTSWEAAWRAIGTQGTAFWDGHAGIRGERIKPAAAFIREGEAVAAPDVPALASEGHAAGIEDFVTALREGRLPATHGDDNIRSLAMIHAAIASAERGGARVSVAELH